jgi:hypothetical protein
VLGNYMPRDGLDNCRTISTTQSNGARSSVVYADRRCRINTFGNSFTLCQQVSDHETWQEYLAGHLGEPIRNFGMGGYGVYQAFRRMVRTEQSDASAKYVILYIWGDDQYRSLLRCRHVLIRSWWDNAGGRMLHCNFWANLEMDPDSGRFIQKENLLPTPTSLYQMTDPEFMHDALRDDLMLQMSLFYTDQVDEVDTMRLNRLADALECPPITTTDRPEAKRHVARIRDAYALGATKHILDRAAAFVKDHNKKLMVILFCPRVTRQLISGQPRYDQAIVDYLQDREMRHFDMNLAHRDDFKCFNLSLDDYMRRYLIGHYSPAGNHFFAYAIKDSIVDWLDPKPVTYRGDEQAAIDFRGYLPDPSL